MAKKFAEHNGLNLTQTNNDVLAAWEKNDIFHKSIPTATGLAKNGTANITMNVENPHKWNAETDCLLSELLKH